MFVPSEGQEEAVRCLAVASFAAPGGSSNGMSARGGGLVACGMENGSVGIWDCVTWACISETALPSAPIALLWRVAACVPGAPAALFCASSDSSDILMLLPHPSAGPLSGPLPWNVHRLQGAAADGTDGFPLCLCWMQGLLCVGTNDGIVQVWDTLSYTVTARLRHVGAVYCIASADDAPAENNPTQPADGDARNLLLSTTAEGIWVWRCSQRGWYVATRVDIHPEQTPTCLCWAPWSHRPARQKVT